MFHIQLSNHSNYEVIPKRLPMCLVVPVVVPIPGNSSLSTNFSKLINLSSGFEVKRRRFFSVFDDARDCGQWFWKGFGGNPFGMGD